MSKKYLLILFSVFIFLATSCQSTKQNLGEQPAAYTQIWQEVAYLTDSSNKNETITFSSNEEALIFMLAEQQNEYAELEKERDYYKQQAEEENIVYVAVTNSNSTTNPTDLIGFNKISNTVSVSSNYDFSNAVTIYTYQDGKIYDVFFNPLNITDIKLQPGEEIVTAVLGDPNNWLLEQVSSVENGQICMHVFVRPYNINISTDCEILTTYRNYYLRFYSSDKAQVAVQWRYPYASGTQTASTATGSTSSSTTGSSGSGIVVSSTGSVLAPDVAAAVSSLNFNYVIEGKASWKPERVFSDTQRTYIQFSNAFLSNTEGPVPYLKTGNAEEELINFTAKGINYIIPIILSSNQKIILKTEKAEVSVYQAVK